MKQRCDDEPTTTTTNDLRIGRRHLDGVIWTAAFGQRHSESMPGENRESKQNRPVRGKLTRRLFGNGMISNVEIICEWNKNSLCEWNKNELLMFHIVVQNVIKFMPCGNVGTTNVEGEKRGKER